MKSRTIAKTGSPGSASLRMAVSWVRPVRTRYVARFPSAAATGAGCRFKRLPRAPMDASRLRNHDS